MAESFHRGRRSCFCRWCYFFPVLLFSLLHQHCKMCSMHAVTLGALFQNNLGRWWGGARARSLRSMHSYAHDWCQVECVCMCVRVCGVLWRVESVLSVPFSALIATVGWATHWKKYPHIHGYFVASPRFNIPSIYGYKRYVLRRTYGTCSVYVENSPRNIRLRYFYNAGRTSSFKNFKSA